VSGSSTCRSCQRPIVWAKTTNGKNMCVDPDPSERGNLVLEAKGMDAGRPAFTVRHARDDDAADVKRYVSHFVTCPDAKHFRRPR